MSLGAGGGERGAWRASSAVAARSNSRYHDQLSSALSTMMLLPVV